MDGSSDVYVEECPTNGDHGERPIQTSAVGLPMNAYTMGYYDGLYGVGPIKGLEGSERYMAGHEDGTAVWGGYLRIAKGGE